jgi:DNA primase
MNINSTAVENYLRDKTEVRSGWRANDQNEKRICCPFCIEKHGTEDTKYHLGVNISNGMFHCYRCESGGFITKLIRFWDNISFSEAVKLVEEAKEREISIDRLELGIMKPKKEVEEKLSSIKPPEYYESLVGNGHPYLESPKRRVDLKMVNDYSLGICRMGAYKDRIIIPDFNDDGGLIYWQARAIDDTVKPKYLNASNSRSGLTLFNFWRAKKHDMIVLTEGPFDAMRVGFNGVATYGHSIKNGQRKLILNSPVKEVVLMYDADVPIDDIESMAAELTSFKKVSIVYIQNGDPADHTQEELLSMIDKRKTMDEIFFEIFSKIALNFRKFHI